MGRAAVVQLVGVSVLLVLCCVVLGAKGQDLPNVRLRGGGGNLILPLLQGEAIGLAGKEGWVNAFARLTRKRVAIQYNSTGSGEGEVIKI